MRRTLDFRQAQRRRFGQGKIQGIVEIERLVVVPSSRGLGFAFAPSDLAEHI